MKSGLSGSLLSGQFRGTSPAKCVSFVRGLGGSKGLLRDTTLTESAATIRTLHSLYPQTWTEKPQSQIPTLETRVESNPLHLPINSAPASALLGCDVWPPEQTLQKCFHSTEIHNSAQPQITGTSDPLPHRAESPSHSAATPRNICTQASA